MRVLAAFVVLASVVVLPGSAAQPAPDGVELQLTAQPHTVPIKPMEGVGTVPFELTIRCPAGAVRTGHTTLAVSLRVVPDAPWATTSLEPVQVLHELPPHECAAGTEETFAGTVSITMSHEAPAGAVAGFKLQAVAEGESTAEFTWNETVAPYLNAKARPESTIWKVAPGRNVSVPIHIENFGNDAIWVDMVATSGEALHLVNPPRTEVAPGVDGRVAFQVASEGSLYENRRDNVAVEVRFASLIDPELVAREILVVVVQTQGSAIDEAPVPTPLLVVTLLGALLVAGRRSNVLSTKVL